MNKLTPKVCRPETCAWAALRGRPHVHPCMSSPPTSPRLDPPPLPPRTPHCWSCWTPCGSSSPSSSSISWTCQATCDVKIKIFHVRAKLPQCCTGGLTFCSSSSFFSSLFLLLEDKNTTDQHRKLTKSALSSSPKCHTIWIWLQLAVLWVLFVLFLLGFLLLLFLLLLFCERQTDFLVDSNNHITVSYLRSHTERVVPSELDSELLFFSSSSTGVNSSELLGIEERISGFLHPYVERHDLSIILCQCNRERRESSLTLALSLLVNIPKLQDNPAHRSSPSPADACDRKTIITIHAGYFWGELPETV